MLRYVLAFVALLVLTTVTLALSFAELGAAGLPVAVAIAVAKSVVIALFFMHLAEHRTSSWVAFTTGVLLAVLLIAFSLLDVASRHPPPATAATEAAVSSRVRDAAPRSRPWPCGAGLPEFRGESSAGSIRRDFRAPSRARIVLTEGARAAEASAHGPAHRRSRRSQEAR